MSGRGVGRDGITHAGDVVRVENPEHPRLETAEERGARLQAIGPPIAYTAIVAETPGTYPVAPFGAEIE